MIKLGYFTSGMAFGLLPADKLLHRPTYMVVDLIYGIVMLGMCLLADHKREREEA